MTTHRLHVRKIPREEASLHTHPGCTPMLLLLEGVPYSVFSERRLSMAALQLDGKVAHIFQRPPPSCWNDCKGTVTVMQADCKTAGELANTPEIPHEPGAPDSVVAGPDSLSVGKLFSPRPMLVAGTENQKLSVSIQRVHVLCPRGLETERQKIGACR